MAVVNRLTKQTRAELWLLLVANLPLLTLVPGSLEEDMARSGARLCVIGPLVGRNGGLVTTQGEILADGLQAAGYEVLAFSSARNRYRRLLDILVSLVRHRARFDIALIQTYGGPSFGVVDAASLVAKILGHRIVMHLRGGSLPSLMARFPAWGRRVLKRADLIVVPSEYLLKAVRALGHDALVIPNVIHTEAYTFRRRAKVAPRLFWMRSFHSIYNPLMAVRVLASVRAHYPEATLVMGGPDKGLLRATKAEAERLDVTASVRFAGFLDRAGKQREGAAADIFINTNHVDNTPVAVIEACAMGVPVVSTAVGGVPYLLRDGQTGLLVPDGDTEAMAAAVRRLVRDPGLALRLSDNGFILAQGCEWGTVRQTWDRILSGLMNDDNTS